MDCDSQWTIQLIYTDGLWLTVDNTAHDYTLMDYDTQSTIVLIHHDGL